MTPAQRRRFWAIIDAHWNDDLGEYIVYSYLIARFGKDSTKALTQSEIDELFQWLDWATGEQQESECP